MAGLDDAVSGYAVRAIEPGAAAVTVDVGGGTGTLVCALLAAHPKLHGIVYDVPDVAPRAEHAIAAAGVGDRCVAQTGDFAGPCPRATSIS